MNAPVAPRRLERPALMSVLQELAKSATADSILASGLARASVVGVVTLLTFVLFAVGNDGQAVFIAALAGLFWPGLTRRAAFWFACTAALALRHIVYWSSLDNHQWLMTYWALALALAQLDEDRREATARSARRLVGLGFLLAVIWKATTVEYVNGSFFGLLSLFSDRFHPLATTLGGLSPGDLQIYDRALSTLLDPLADNTSTPLPLPGRVRLLSWALTWWTLVAESLIALAFLWPRAGGLRRLRNLFLMVFMLSVYPIAPVVGFAAILATLGMAQCRDDEPIARAAYLLGLVALPILM